MRLGRMTTVSSARHSARGQRDQASPQVSVALLFHPSDADRARELGLLLQGAGVSIVPEAMAGTDAIVVFLSAAGLAEPGWVNWLDAATAMATRLVPIRVGQINDQLVPGRLREPNWIDWDPGNVRTTFGSVLAGVLSDPDRRALSRRLSHETDAWLRSGRSDALLIGDYRRARQMAGMLADLAADRLATPSDAMRQFVQRSVKVSRPKHRRRRNRAIIGVVAGVAALFTAAVALPAIQVGTYNNKESIVTTGNQQLLADLPDWSAANAAALLINGTPAEQDLARTTLLRALNTPWEIDALQWQVPPASSAVLPGGTRAILSVGAGLIEIDVQTQRRLWTIAAPGGPYYLSADPAGRTVVGLNSTGAVVLDLASHSGHTIATGTDFVDGELGSDGIAVVRLPGPRLAELNTATGTVTQLGSYPSIISVAAKTPRGNAAALVQDKAGQIELIALPSRTVLASMPGNASAEVGTIAPDGRHAIVEGGDGQFWTFGAGQPATPTGIPVPVVPSGVDWATGDRVVVYSEDADAQVYYLPRAEPIGTTCSQVPRLFQVVPDYTADVVACEGQGGTSFWGLPAGPITHPFSGESGALTSAADRVTVTSSGARIEIRAPGLNTGWYQPLDSDISAVTVGDDGKRVIVGDTVGEAAVIDMEPGYAATVVAWDAPDRSPVDAVGWDGGPVVTTRSGQTWRLTDCPDCGTDAGLLSTYRSRVTGCFSARQLASIGDSMWPVLGLRECTSVPGEPAQLEGN
jgi:hypothetical protein